MKTSWRHFCKTSWSRFEDALARCLEDGLKTPWRRLQNAFNTSWRCLEEDVLRTSWRSLRKMPWRRLEDVLKRSWRRPEDVWSRRIYWSWPRRLEDVSWRHRTKANISALIKTLKISWRRRKKTSSRRLHQDKCFLGLLVFFLLLLLLFFCLVYSLKLSISTFWFICSSNRSFSVITPLQISLRKELIVLNFWKLYVFAFFAYLYRSFVLSFCFFLIHLLVYVVKSILKITDWFYLLFSVFKVYKDFAWFWDVPPIAFLCFPKAFPKGE